ncbi:hypothetical protein DFJ74DRAFT_696473 [Hyaloraphidium curvatum]|nr:hypothetical protein DFJ74DRAFT_696473 [Hyaloraphidium curvatum]
MATYKVLYFPIRARAEVTRLILTYAGAKWENVHPEWPAAKASTPYGQLPVLEETDAQGTFVLAQSKSIERYLARKFGLLGKTEKETAVLDSIVESWTDFNTKWGEFAFAKPEAKEEAKAKFSEQFWPGFAKIHEGLLEKNGGNGHYHGSSVTWPDLVLLYMLERVEDAVPELLSPSATPQLSKALQTIRTDEKLKAYVESKDRVPITFKR